MAKNNNMMKNEGSQGNLFNALICAIKPSNPSIIGWVSVIFCLNRFGGFWNFSPFQRF